MAWEIEYSDEFGEWWENLSADEQEAVTRGVRLLEEGGPGLGRPHAESLAEQSIYPNMKELRVVYRGDAYRVIFAFDPRRIALLLLGDRKPDEKWYKKAVPAADKIYGRHLESLKREK